MDGSAPSVPIITLSAISSFTNLLKNLPLPTSVLQVSQDSLLYNGSLANEAQKILNSPNHNQTLVQELIQSLRLSTTDHIISECPNETPLSELLNNVNAPDLLKFLVLNDSNVFKYKLTYNNNTGYAAKDANNMYNNNNNSNNNNVSTTNINGPCASYEHQQLPFNDQDYEFLMNRLSPNFDQPIGTNEMMMEEVFPSNVQFVGQSMSNMSSNVPGRSTCDDGFNMAGVHKTAPGGVKPFVDNSPAQASSAPPTGAEPVVRMVNNNLNNNNALITNTMIPMYDPSNITNLQYSATQTTTSFQNYNNFYQQQLPMGNFPNPAYLHQSQQHMQPQQQQHLQQHTQQHHMLPHQQAHQQMLQQHMNPFEIVQQQPQQQLQTQHHPQQHHLQQQQQFLRGPIKTSDSKVSTGDRLPRVSLTRLEDDFNNGSNNNNISANSSSQQYDVVNQHSSQQLKIKLSKRGLKRRTSDEDDESSYSSEFAPSLSERVKRRRNAKSVGVKYDVDDVEEEEEKDEEEEEDDSRDAKNRNVMSLLDPSFEDVDDRHRRREERKKKKHHYHHHSSKHRTFIDDDDQTDGPSCRRFYSLIDQVLELSEEIDLAAFKDNEEDEETSCLTDPVVPKNVLVDVVSEAAKLKTVGLMNQIHYDKLIKLMTILQYSIKQGLRSVPIIELDDEDEDLRFRELTLNFVNIGLDACMIAMIILTSPNMPKQVFIEDVIEKVVRFSRQHMKNFIFPSFDPIYKADLSGKGMQASIKSKRSKNSGGSRDRLVISIYNKLTDLVGLLAELVDIQELTDAIILQTSSLSVAPFFVENIPELQLNALKLVTNIFSKYDKHRQLILEDILSSLARLPSNKKNMRSYRLNVDEQIQMVTALALQLIQCVVKLPSKQEHDDNNSNTNSNHNNNTNNNDDDDDDPANFDGEDVGKNRSAEKMTKNRNKIKFNMDKEAMILTSYDTAMFTAHNFLHVFLGNKITTTSQRHSSYNITTTSQLQHHNDIPATTSHRYHYNDNRCTAKEEDDYRSMFGNFVNDLLSTVNKPQWPASELLLSILGSLLVKQFSSKSVEMSLRVASLDYLGIVAARLRKDAVSSHLNESVIDDIIKKVSKKDDDETEDVDKPDVKEEVKQLDGDDAVVDGAIKEKKFNTNICDISRTQLLQKGLLDYLASTTETDHALIFARKFYIAQWLRDCSKEIETKTKKMAEEKMNVKKQRKPKKSAPKSRRHREKSAKHNRSKRRRAIVDDDENEEDEATDNDDTEEEDEEDDDGGAQDNKESIELDILRLTQMEIEKRKNFLFDEISEMHVYKSSIKRNRSRLDYDGALLVTRYLASNRPFSQSFDIYLNKILKVLHESTVAVRSRALKCLAAVIEADPGVLARKDMQIGVHNRFTDSSTSVREAAIDLVGKFILVRPELTAQYYDMLSERILDTGISVRKRVIKIFRDICLEQPKFPKIPEMCVKMVRRVNDEEGIRKLVNETFQSMWFTPCTDKDSSVLVQKVYNITDVVAVASLNIGFEWLEQLLDNLLKKEEETKEKPVEKACTQIVDCLVDNVLQLEQREAELNRYISNATLPGSATTTAATTATPPSRFSSCFSTLFLFCKVKPSLLVKHCIVIHPYLNIKSFNSSDTLIVSNVLKILELSLPLMEHPGEMFLAKVEEDISKLVLRHGPMVRLIASVVQKIRDVQFNTLTSTPLSTLDSMKVSLRRSLYVVGLLCKHFDFDSKEFDSYRKVSNVEAKVFEIFLHFLDFPDDSVRLQSLTAIGSLVSQHYELMLGKELRDMYHHMLTDPSVPSNMCSQVLCNIKDYLAEEEVKMAKADAEWRKLHDKENLKEMGDVQSGMASTIIQVYLKQILESFFHLDQQVRMSALEVVVLILNQGLVHPQQCMAHLISMGSDANVNIRLKADKQIQDIDKKYPGFVQAKAMQGIKMSCRLQKLLYGTDSQQHNAGNQQQQQQQQPGQLRGVRMEEDGTMTSLNSFVYSVVRGNRSNRRVLVMNALRMFEDKTPLNELLYMADNLAYFSYQLQDEPLFIMHQIDIILSVSGFNLIQSFREVFYPALQQQQQSQQQQQHQVQTKSQHVFDSCSTLATTTASEATTTSSTTTTWTPYVVATTSVNDCQRWSRMPCDDIYGNCSDVVAVVDGHHNQDSNLNTSAADHPKNTTVNNVNSDDCYISRTSYSNDRDINSTDNYCNNNNEDSKNNNNNDNNNNNNEEYELMTSMTNTQQALINRRKFEDDDDDDDDLETLLELVPSEGTSLIDLYMSLQGYLLLLVLKQHLKEMYGFTDNKIQRYSPTDVKLYEKAVNRKHGVKFHPKQALDVLGRSGQMSQMLDEDRREIVAAYINFKELMASIDKDDLDDNEAAAGTTTTTSTSRAATSSGNPGNLDGTTTTSNNNNNTFVQPSSNGQMMKPLTTTPRKANHSSNSYGSNINSSSGGSSSSKAASRKSRNPSNTSRSSSSLSSSAKKNKSKKKKSKRKRISYNSDSEEEEEEDDEEEEEDGDDWN
ncbi:hypothetical protein HELRODRAFT_189155 [Helobdella robusta]|uniref:Nipped-B protein n=1 Tax=Helobdella robusta TaxID=6412 RepID=T1FQQ3_HELRO|nr:hypothetical protein HELRODRAFT_189155 [Helobdella robusta]ESN96221.1 hypothetical protein HELRODRAFT_189155 [Helobdella robusta]